MLNFDYPLNDMDKKGALLYLELSNQIYLPRVLQ